jgi:hypothetical membrane protein
MSKISYLNRQLDFKFISFIFYLGILAQVMMMVIIITVGQITPNYSPISETISQMGARERPYSIILNSSYILYGTIIIYIVYSLYRRLFHTTMINTLAVFMIMHAIGSIFLAVFPDKTDTSGGYFSENIIHNTFSGISYITLLLTILIYSIATIKVKNTKSIAIAGISVVSINLVMPLINVVSYFEEISGMLQRLIIFCSFSWIIVNSIILYKRNYFKNPVYPVDKKTLISGSPLL